MNPLNTFISIIILFFVSHFTLATEYNLPPPNFRLIGVEQSHKVKKGDYFQKIAEQYNVGFLALMAANPNIAPFLPEINT
jgi:L,D-transpeptidase ErfK/SrfK/L,D-transpeptidase YbiS